MLKKVSLTVTIICCISLASFSQKHELGVNLGVSNFMGDLGGANKKGTPFLGDLEPKLFRPAAGLHHRIYFNPRWAINSSINWGVLAGKDQLIQTEYRSDEWFRYYRNLSFRSHVVDASVKGEFYFIEFTPGSIRKRIGAYVGLGLGAFWFNPKTKYNGRWIALQPLGTEGQGLSQFPSRKKYLRFQPNTQTSLGLKYNLSYRWNIGIELTYKHTFTDYIDDVSKDYVAYEAFQADYDDATAQMVYALSRRSVELDPEGVDAAVTAAGEQRGDASNEDHYFFTLVSLNYIFRGKSDYNCPFGRR